MEFLSVVILHHKNFSYEQDSFYMLLSIVFGIMYYTKTSAVLLYELAY